MKNTNRFRIIILIQIILLISCSESWLDEKPPHLIASETLYANLAGFETGLNGLYSLVREERGDYGGTSLRCDMLLNCNDNICTNAAGQFALTAQDFNNLLNADDIYVTSNFTWLYNVVNAANTIINQAEDRDDVNWTGGQGRPDDNKNIVIAQARAIRAWAYRHLTYLWGDVPLSLEESKGSSISTDWVRTPVKEVRKQMKLDWLFAEQYLTVEPSSPGKITKGAVQHYLAELYLILGKPDSALFWANKCIHTPEYKLVTERYGVRLNQPGCSFSDMFADGNTLRHQGNTESLWSWEYEYGVSGGGNSKIRRWHTSRYDLIKIGKVQPLQLTVERGGRGIFRMSMTKWALDCYEPEDDRFSNAVIRKYFILMDATQNAPAAADRLPVGYNYGDTIKMDWSQEITPTNRGTNYTWPFCRKFESTPEFNLAESAQYNDQVYLRLAETYLLKAEAQFILGLVNDAAQTINIIRSRSNASMVDGSQIDIDFILDERSRELVLEEHRRYTLLRTGKWLERVQKYNKNGGQNTSDKHTLFPIPQVVIDANLTTPMTNNPGYNP